MGRGFAAITIFKNRVRELFITLNSRSSLQDMYSDFLVLKISRMPRREVKEIENQVTFHKNPIWGAVEPPLPTLGLAASRRVVFGWFCARNPAKAV